MDHIRNTHPARLVIRRAGPGDELSLRRLAALDDRRPISGPQLVAEVDGELRAALSLTDGRSLGDPFHRTDAVVRVLAEAEAA